MPMRKPPCPPKCPLRRPACQAHCETFAPYAAQIEQDRIDKQKYHEQNSDWTDATKRMAKKQAKIKQKKERGIHK